MSRAQAPASNATDKVRAAAIFDPSTPSLGALSSETMARRIPCLTFNPVKLEKSGEFCLFEALILVDTFPKTAL
jgi:hypothetical protein